MLQSCSRLDHHLDGFARFHRTVTVGHAVETNRAVEHATRLDAAVEHIGLQFLDLDAHRCRATSDSDVAVEHRFRLRDRLVVQQANEADRDIGALHELSGDVDVVVVNELLVQSSLPAATKLGCARLGR